MTPQGAINHIRQQIKVDIDCISETNEALYVIQKLVDKSTSKKPVIIDSPADYNERCPNCNERVDVFQDQRFCNNCGQALDWNSS